MWITLLVAAPELRASFEFHLRFDVDRCRWDSVVLSADGAPVCLSGDCATTAHELFRWVFAAIGHAELVPAVA